MVDMPPSLRTPPPEQEGQVLFATVRLVNMSGPVTTWNFRYELFPLMVTSPPPLMVSPSGSVMSGRDITRVMVLMPSAKVMVSFPEPAAQSAYVAASSLALVMASRRSQVKLASRLTSVSSALPSTIIAAAYTGVTISALQSSRSMQKVTTKRLRNIIFSIDQMSPRKGTCSFSACPESELRNQIIHRLSQYRTAAHQSYPCPAGWRGHTYTC